MVPTPNLYDRRNTIIKCMFPAPERISPDTDRTAPVFTNTRIRDPTIGHFRGRNDSQGDTRIQIFLKHVDRQPSRSRITRRIRKVFIPHLDTSIPRWTQNPEMPKRVGPSSDSISDAPLYGHPSLERERQRPAVRRSDAGRALFASQTWITLIVYRWAALRGC